MKRDPEVVAQESDQSVASSKRNVDEDSKNPKGCYSPGNSSEMNVGKEPKEESKGSLSASESSASVTSRTAGAISQAQLLQKTKEEVLAEVERKKKEDYSERRKYLDGLHRKPSKRSENTFEMYPIHKLRDLLKGSEKHL